MISKKTRIDKWNYYSNIYSVLCKYIARYGNGVRKMCDNNEIGFYFSLIKKKMDKHMNEGLKKYDLTKSQQDVLGYLHFTDKDPVIQRYRRAFSYFESNGYRNFKSLGTEGVY